MSATEIYRWLLWLLVPFGLVTLVTVGLLGGRPHVVRAIVMFAAAILALAVVVAVVTTVAVFLGMVPF
jgi:hypothetical protein